MVWEDDREANKIDAQDRETERLQEVARASARLNLAAKGNTTALRKLSNDFWKK